MRCGIGGVMGHSVALRKSADDTEASTSVRAAPRHAILRPGLETEMGC